MGRRGLGFWQRHSHHRHRSPSTTDHDLALQITTTTTVARPKTRSGCTGEEGATDRHNGSGDCTGEGCDLVFGIATSTTPLWQIQKPNPDAQATERDLVVPGTAPVWLLADAEKKAVTWFLALPLPPYTATAHNPYTSDIGLARPTTTTTTVAMPKTSPYKAKPRLAAPGPPSERFAAPKPPSERLAPPKPPSVCALAPPPGPASDRCLPPPPAPSKAAPARCLPPPPAAPPKAPSKAANPPPKRGPRGGKNRFQWAKKHGAKPTPWVKPMQSPFYDPADYRFFNNQPRDAYMHD